jgi:hypothetical protein
VRVEGAYAKERKKTMYIGIGTVVLIVIIVLVVLMLRRLCAGFRRRRGRPVGYYYGAGQRDATGRSE